VIVEMGPYFLQVKGTIIANGEPMSPIVFRGQHDGTDMSGGVYVETNAGVKGTANATQAKSVISHAKFENEGDDQAIAVWGDTLLSNIDVSGSGLGLFDEATLNESRICTSSSYGVRASGNPTIQNSMICENETGIYLHSLNGVTIVNNQIIGNNGRDHHGGIRLDNLGDQTKPIIIRGNTISGGMNAIVFTRADGEPQQLVDISFNSFSGNLQFAIRQWEDSRAGIVLTNNWWGTTDPVQIRELIWDFERDFRLGKVYFEPVLSSASPVESLPTPTPTAIAASISVVPPTFSSTVTLGQSYFMGAFTAESDLSGDLLAATVDWGDGTSITNALVIQRTGEIEAHHNFSSTGTFEGTLYVTSESGGSASASFVLVVVD